MSFGDLLTTVANGVLSGWDGLASAASGAWHGVDYVLNPVLSPLLAVLNPISTSIGDFVYALLAPLPPWVGLTIISALTGVVMLIAFRYTSNQDAITRVKDDIKANLLALKLYKDELRVVFSSQVRILWAILKLQRYVLTPVLVMLLPMLLGLAQMGVHYQWGPAPPGKPVLVKVQRPVGEGDNAPVTLDPGDGVQVEAGPLRGAEDIAWRVRSDKPGRHTLRFVVGDDTFDKEFVVGTGFTRISALRPGHVWTDQILHPIESPISSDAPIHSITIDYPAVQSYICGSNYWVVYFFVVSMIVALILKPVFKVKF